MTLASTGERVAVVFERMIKTIREFGRISVSFVLPYDI